MAVITSLRCNDGIGIRRMVTLIFTSIIYIVNKSNSYQMFLHFLNVEDQEVAYTVQSI